MTQNEQFMLLALEQAHLAQTKNEVPVGAIIIDGNQNVIARGHNTVFGLKSIIGHAEINTILEATQKLGTSRLISCSIYVTLEPCLMCIGTIMQARLSHLYYGANSYVYGALSKHLVAESSLHFKIHKQILAAPSIVLLQDFFKKKRSCQLCLAVDPTLAID